MTDSMLERLTKVIEQRISNAGRLDAVTYEECARDVLKAIVGSGLDDLVAAVNEITLIKD